MPIFSKNIKTSMEILGKITMKKEDRIPFILGTLMIICGIGMFVCIVVILGI